MSRLSMLLLPALVGCAATVSVPASPPAPSPAGIVAGTYATTIVESDIPASAPAPAEMRAGLVGRWEITVDGSGRALVRFNGQQVVEGPYQINGQEITFSAEDTGSYACRVPGRYTWRISNGELRFTKLEDNCEGRVIALTSHPWTLQR